MTYVKPELALLGRPAAVVLGDPGGDGDRAGNPTTPSALALGLDD
jgi:hypothetical protein